MALLTIPTIMESKKQIKKMLLKGILLTLSSFERKYEIQPNMKNTK
tara:strand:+ start:41016 stop:41153 length:138 start_codon:yes stop_codon:yes gene_type:complete